MPLIWDASDAPRRIRVRPLDGRHDWCAPFSPETVGESVLKLRPIEGSGSAAADGAVLYLRLTVTMRGSQRLLLFRALPEGGLPLPYRVSNSSAALLAFRQLGCPHWDLLGGGEACEYLWDDPTATRALELRSRDPSGLHSAASSVALEKADARPTALELMTKGQFAEGVAKAGWARRRQTKPR